MSYSIYEIGMKYSCYHTTKLILYQGIAKGPVTEEITLYLSSQQHVYHVSYVVRPSSASETIVKVIPYETIPTGPEPILAPPVVVNPEGQSPAEEVEKTFFQKYWIYLLPILLFLITSGAGAQQQEQE